MLRRCLRPAVLAALAAAATALSGAAPAHAGVLVASATDCESVTTDRVFAPWVDPAEYFLAPDGGFEAGAAGWDLDGASVVAGNEPFHVSGPGTKALDLQSGSSAMSPVVCVGVTRPTVRFFARKASGAMTSTLRVDVLFEDAMGDVQTLPVGTTSGSSAWAPSPVMVVVPSLLPLLPGSYTPVAFRFVPQGGSWQVDDVHVDPYGSR